MSTGSARLWAARRCMHICLQFWITDKSLGDCYSIRPKLIGKIIFPSYANLFILERVCMYKHVWKYNNNRKIAAVATKRRWLSVRWSSWRWTLASAAVASLGVSSGALGGRRGRARWWTPLVSRGGAPGDNRHGSARRWPSLASRGGSPCRWMRVSAAVAFLFRGPL
jgi:hypothetical protein